MQKIQSQLKGMLGTLSKTLVVISKQVQKMADKVNQLQPEAPPGSVSRKKELIKKKAAPAKMPMPKRRRAVESTGTVIDAVFNTISSSRSGIAIPELKEKSQIEGRQLSNALYKLTKKGMIRARSRGVYVAVK